MNEAAFWRQRYEMLMANFGDMVKAATAKQPVLLADKESYELGKLHGEISEREACAELCELQAKQWSDAGCFDVRDFKLCATAIRARGQA